MAEKVESACNAGDQGLIPGSRRYPGEGNGNPLWYSCLENSMDRGAWLATVHGVEKLVTTERLTLGEWAMHVDTFEVYLLGPYDSRPLSLTSIAVIYSSSDTKKQM